MSGVAAPLEVEEAPRSGALDLHEGISTPGPAGCPRWPEHMRLLSSQGEVVRGRCRATNRCAYCAKLAAVENAELLALDALVGGAPAIWCVLTTALAEPDPAHFYAGRRKVFLALKRRWPDCEYAALVEFTTGYGERSGGRRRPHWNLLLKGIPADAIDEAQEIVRRVWCQRDELQAKPAAQFVGLVSEVGGLLRYIALHFQKESQAPPEGWRGHRFLHSRGYLATSTPEARAAARESLAFKRELWRAIKAGLVGEDAEQFATEQRELARTTTWQLVDVTTTLTAATSGAPGRARGCLSDVGGGAGARARSGARAGSAAGGGRSAARQSRVEVVVDGLKRGRSTPRPVAVEQPQRAP